MSSPAPDYLHLLRVELARLGAVDPDHLNKSIPHIEGWTVSNVIGHTGWVARYATQAIAATPDAPPSRSDVPEPPPGHEVIAWYDEGQKALLAAVESADPEHICPTFTGPQPVRWWQRRLAHEASIHRWDAYAATGSPDAIDPNQARDAIDEVFEVFASVRMQFDVLGGAGETLHFHATDIDDGEWLVTLGADGIEWSHEHAKADVAARGPVSDLLLMLWGRIPPSRLELFGDATLLDRWQGASAF